MKLRRVMETKSPAPSAPPTPVSLPQYPVPYLMFLLLLIVSIGIYVAIEYSSDLLNIQQNWGEYRCQPHIMPLAGLFGHDVNENFQFCIHQVVQENTKGVAAPFAVGMGGFTSVLMNLMNSANSFRVMLATLVGGVIKIISEFKARMTSLMGRIKVTSGRMKAMMYRIYGTMFAVMYMGMSATTGIANFGDSFIFKFIDTFCFPPEQAITLESGITIPISNVKIGDRLKGGHEVEIVYRFAADGQDMVKLNDVVVSSNHFLKYNGAWKMAKDHPDAIAVGPWSGGVDRPLICLTTNSHLLPIGDYTFADYDETEKGDRQTQEWINMSLNGTKQTIKATDSNFSYDIGAPSTRRVIMLHGSMKELRDIKLGDIVKGKGKVVGIQTSIETEFCMAQNGDLYGKGALLWSIEKGAWVRAYTVYPYTRVTVPIETIALFVSPGAQYELEGGQIVRDAMEVYSPDTKKAYAEALINTR